MHTTLRRRLPSCVHYQWFGASAGVSPALTPGGVTLETFLDVQLIKLIEIRRSWGVGWAGVEEMYMAVELA
ncbi:hypothetical protein B0H13DRAFT_2351504 [Mycena leptocephala]|nr:hypothetical protein B0H13DRAFT_2351504 [Mycena leptocephala]